MAVDKKGVQKNKVKGIPRRAVTDFFKNYSAEYNAPMRFRESRRRHLQPNIWHKRIRSLKSVYEKRVKNLDGTTSPLILK